MQEKCRVSHLRNRKGDGSLWLMYDLGTSLAGTRHQARADKRDHVYVGCGHTISACCNSENRPSHKERHLRNRNGNIDGRSSLRREHVYDLEWLLLVVCNQHVLKVCDEHLATLLQRGEAIAGRLVLRPDGLKTLLVAGCDDSTPSTYPEFALRLRLLVTIRTSALNRNPGLYMCRLLRIRSNWSYRAPIEDCNPLRHVR
jgi:hypothetical protein